MLTGISTAQVRTAWTHAERIATAKAQDEASRRVVRPVGSRRPREYEGEGARKLHGRGLSYLWGAALLLGDDPGSSDVEPVWSWFEELLVGRDPGLRLVNQGNATVEATQRLGFLLSRASRPAEVFHKTYERLEPQRRRAQYGVRYGYARDDLGVTLKKAIPPLANHPRMLADACWFLWKNGVDPGPLSVLVREAGGDLEESLRDLKQWADLGAQNRRELEFPAELQRLAEVLGVYSSTEDAPQEAE